MLFSFWLFVLPIILFIVGAIIFIFVPEPTAVIQDQITQIRQMDQPQGQVIIEDLEKILKEHESYRRR